jgi:hypothetical protein
MSFYSDQAAQFGKMAEEIQTWLIQKGSTLDDASYAYLEKQRDILLDQTNAMVLDDIQAVLDQLKLDQPRLEQCTTTLNNAVKTVKKFDQVVAIVAASVALAAAIISVNPAAIASAVVDAEKAVTGALTKDKTDAVKMLQPVAETKSLPSPDNA